MSDLREIRTPEPPMLVVMVKFEGNHYYYYSYPIGATGDEIH